MSTATAHSASAENDAAHELIRKVVTVVTPLTDRIIDGEFQLVPAASVTLEEVSTAVFMATGCMPRDIVPVSRRSLAADDVGFAYVRTLDRAIETLFGFRLVVALGNKKWQQHRRHFGYEEVIPLEARLAPSTERLPWENLRSAMFHFWGLALARQDGLIDRLVPLVALLPKAIPLGEIAGRPGIWAVLTA